MIYLYSSANLQKSYYRREFNKTINTSGFLKHFWKKNNSAVKFIPLSNTTVSRRIHYMSEDIETQLVDIQISLFTNGRINCETMRGSTARCTGYTD